MSKQYSIDLFSLIKSLSKSEKRYFKLQSATGSDAKYARLFDAFDRLSDNDERLILKQCTWIKPSQFSNLKAHLYKQLLKSIRMYNSGNVTDVQTRELIDFVQILFNRNLYQQCVKMISKARRLAQRSDNLELQLETLKWEKRLLPYTIGRNNRQKANEIISEVQKVNDRITMINQLSNLSIKLNAIYLKTGFIRHKRDLDYVSKIVKQDLPAFQESELSFNEKMALYDLNVTYYSYIQDFENGHTYAKRWVDLIDQHSTRIPERLDIYTKALNSLLIAQYRLFKYHEFQKTKRKLRTLRNLPEANSNENIRLKLFKYTYAHEFNGFFMMGDFKKGVDLMDRIKPGLEAFIAQLDNHSKLVLYHKIACLYFGNGNFNGSLIWLNKIINSGDIDLREDVHCFARIMSLVAHYELGNMDVIDYYLRSTYRFLSKKDDLHSFQKYILAFIKKLDRDITEQELNKRFEQLIESLIPLTTKQFDKRAFYYFDMISWLESKIHKKPIGQLIKNKGLNRINISESDSAMVAEREEVLQA
ncbi:MAG: hypothetical protein AAFX87_18785 [Bacteroidota bacterium]